MLLLTQILGTGMMLCSVRDPGYVSHCFNMCDFYSQIHLMIQYECFRSGHNVWFTVMKVRKGLRKVFSALFKDASWKLHTSLPFTFYLLLLTDMVTPVGRRVWEMCVVFVLFFPMWPYTQLKIRCITLKEGENQ